MCIRDRPLPVAEFTLPRVLQEYDFGPQPVRGFMASPGAAADAVWGQTISGVAGAIGSGMSALGASGNFGGGGGTGGINSGGHSAMDYYSGGGTNEWGTVTETVIG